jgi:hypothetical protein
LYREEEKEEGGGEEEEEEEKEEEEEETFMHRIVTGNGIWAHHYDLQADGQ